MQELFNKHMIGTFAVEIAVLTIALWRCACAPRRRDECIT